jgi:hypothetical protein
VLILSNRPARSRQTAISYLLSILDGAIFFWF